MYLFLILLCHFAKNQIKTTENVDEYSFIQNERIIYQQDSYFIPFNNNEELQSIKQNFDYFKLINLQKSFSIEGIDSNSRIHLLTSNQQNSVKICIQNYQNMHCQLEIAPFIKNNELQLKQIQQNFILPNNLCFEVYPLIYDLVLIFCNFYQNQNSLYIIDQLGVITDQMLIQITENCSQKLSLNNDTFIIYNQNCQNHNLMFLRIDFQEKKIQVKKIFDSEFFNSSKFEQIISISVCSPTQIIINFQKIIVLFSIEEQISKRILFSIYDILAVQENCQIQAIIGFQTNSQELSSAYYGGSQEQNAVIDLMLNFSQQECKEMLLVNENILIKTNKQLIIINNQYLNYTFNSVIDFKQIQKLPIIVILKNDQNLSIYDICQIQNIIQFQQTQYQASLAKINFKVYLANVKIIKTSEIILSDTTEIQVNNLTFNQEKQYGEFTYLNLAFIQSNLPIYLVNYTSNDFLIRLKTEGETICQLSDQKSIVIKQLTWRDSCYKLIYYVQNETVKKQNIYQMSCCIDRQKSELIFQSNNLIDIASSYNFLIIFDELQVVCFDVFGNLTLVKKRIFQLQSKIVSIISSKFSHIVNLEDDSQYQIYRFQEEFKIELIKSGQTFDNNSFVFSQNPNNTNDQYGSQLQLSKSDQNQFDIIIDTKCQYIEKHNFVSKQRWLIICVHKNQTLTMNLYLYKKTSIILLYQIPLYNFSIKLPLIIVYNDFQFCVQVEKGNKNDSYLFIYNVNRISSQTLSQIIKIENNTSIFFLSIMKLNSIFFCQGVNCYFKSINIDQLKLTINKESDSFLINSQIQLTFSTLINELQRKSITVEYQFFNQFKSLRFRKNIQSSRRYFYLNDKNQLIGLEKIFGEIENIVIPNDFGKIIDPIQPKSQLVVFCHQIFESFCFTKNQTLIYDPFGLQIYIDLPKSYQIFQIQCIQSAKLLKILFLTQGQELELLTIENWLDSETSNMFFSVTKFNIQLSFFQNKIMELCQFCNTALFFSLNQQFHTFDLRNNLYVQHQESINFFSNENAIFYEFFEDSDAYNFVKIFLTTNHELQLIQFQITNNSIQEKIRVILFSKVNNFRIASMIENRNLLIMDLTYLDSESQSLNYIQVQYDTENLIVINSKIKHVFRTLGINFRDFQIIDNILLVSSEVQSISEGVYFYNLHKQYLDLNFTDYYFKANLSNNHVKIQRYNNSYQVLIDLITDQIHLVDLRYYTCIQSQQKKESNLLLTNQVSQLQVKLRQKIQDEQYLWLESVLTINFFFIIFLIKCIKKENKKRLRQIIK